MPIVIGAKPESTFADPIGLLTDCHRRIERFLSTLAQVTAQARGNPLDREQRASLETALRYFREAAPKHTADEEQTLFPRLRRLAQATPRPEVKPVLARMESLEQDHDRAEAGHAEVERLGRIWLACGSLPAPGAAKLSALLADLAELYRGHIAVEEGEVFPLAASLLPGAEREAIGGEMALRRGLFWAPATTVIPTGSEISPPSPPAAPTSAPAATAIRAGSALPR